MSGRYAAMPLSRHERMVPGEAARWHWANVAPESSLGPRTRVSCSDDTELGSAIHDGVYVLPEVLGHADLDAEVIQLGKAILDELYVDHKRIRAANPVARRRVQKGEPARVEFVDEKVGMACLVHPP